jgi:adenosine 3'-phospho 5'-phosphosulfate transporter B3
MASSSLSNMSLNYINFPTKVVFRSCKLIPTMIIATIINKRVFKSYEYVSAMAISLGLVIFAAADWQLTPTFNPIGLVLVSFSVIADAILPNAQERLFGLGSSRLEVTFYTNFFTFVVMTVTALASGDLVRLLKLALTSDTNLLAYMVVYTLISYIAISAFMAIVKQYGGTTAVLLSTARKSMTLILSFLLFPKVFSWYYILGASLVLGGLIVVGLKKQYSKLSSNSNSSPNNEMQPLTKESTCDDRDIEIGNDHPSSRS